MKLRLGNPRIKKSWTSNYNPVSAIGYIIGVAAYCFICWLVEGNRGLGSTQTYAASSLILCCISLLARRQFMVNFDSGEIISTSGIWPFIRTERSTVNQISRVEMDAKGFGGYQLWLVKTDGHRIPAGVSTWKKINGLGRSIAELGQWPFEDFSNRESTKYQFTNKPKR